MFLTGRLFRRDLREVRSAGQGLPACFLVEDFFCLLISMSVIFAAGIRMATAASNIPHLDAYLPNSRNSVWLRRGCSGT